MDISASAGAYDEYATRTSEELAGTDFKETRTESNRTRELSADVPSESQANSPRIHSAEQDRNFSTSIMNAAYTGKGSVIDFMT